MWFVSLLLPASLAWMSKFERTADTMPVVRVVLDPPRKPHFLVSEVLTKLERERVDMEQNSFEKLEAEFDKQLDKSKEDTKTIVVNALKVLQDQGTLDLVVGSVSFLQLEGVTDTIKNHLSNMAVPSMNVELVDVFSPDTKIEQKIRQIEQKFNSKETERFKKASKIFQNITTIFLDETKKNLQIQLNHFMVDAKAVSSSVSKHRSSSRFFQLSLDNDTSSRLSLNGDTPPSLTDHQSPPFANQHTSLLNDTVPLTSDRTFKPILSVDLSGGYPLESAFFPGFVSFVETESAPLGLNAEQLNVAVGESDLGYPTISDVVDQSVRKRAAAERLERTKILQMSQKLMRAQIEILKDILHYEVAKSISLLGSTVTGLKL